MIEVFIVGEYKFYSDTVWTLYIYEHSNYRIYTIDTCKKPLKKLSKEMVRKIIRENKNVVYNVSPDKRELIYNLIHNGTGGTVEMEYKVV